MRYRLRTLLIVLAVGPVVLAGAWFLGGVLWTRFNAPKAGLLGPPKAYGAQVFYRDENGKSHTITPDGRDVVLDP